MNDFWVQMLVFYLRARHSLVMGQNQVPGGPASLLKTGTSWLDSKVAFGAQDRKLAEAARMIWTITRQMRAAQGERRLSITELSVKADLRRQTVAQALMGEVWPDTQTLLRLCAVLDLELNVTAKE